MTAIKNIRFSSTQKRKALLGVLAATLLTGVFIGTFFVTTGKDIVWLHSNSVFRVFVKKVSERGLAAAFLCAFKPLLMLLTAQFLLGFFAVGQPVSLITAAFEGIAAGVSISSVYLEYGIRGALISLVMFAPYLTARCIIAVVGARESIRLSVVFLMYILGGDNTDRPDLRLYGLRFIVLMMFSAVVSAADGVIAVVFYRLLIP